MRLSAIAHSVHPRMGGEQSRHAGHGWRGFGSSPHGRGTGPEMGQAAFPQRFIPAWAGNSWLRRCLWSQSAVHPRMGGEQAGATIMLVHRVGSSPHGRGTAEEVRHPAHTRPVHPRMGGEQAQRYCSDSPYLGSSPHGRGTGKTPQCREGCRRFIPAWAGNREE